MIYVCLNFFQIFPIDEVSQSLSTTTEQEQDISEKIDCRGCPKSSLTLKEFNLHISRKKSCKDFYTEEELAISKQKAIKLNKKKQNKKNNPIHNPIHNPIQNPIQILYKILYKILYTILYKILYKSYTNPLQIL